MKRLLVVLGVGILTAGSARAQNHLVIDPSESGDIEVQFVYSKAYFQNALALGTADTAVTFPADPYMTAAGSPIMSPAADLSQVLFDEGVCAPDTNRTAGGSCSDNGTITAGCIQAFDCTCDCQGNKPFFRIGDTTTLGRDLDFQLYTFERPSPQDTSITAPTVPTRRLDSDPASSLNYHPGDADVTTPRVIYTRLGTNTYLMTWEDGVSLGDKDYNDMVAIVRVVPSNCNVSSPPAYCTAGQFVSPNVAMFPHLEAGSPLNTCTTGAEPTCRGMQMISQVVNFDSQPHDIAICHRLRVPIPGFETALTTQKLDYITPLAGDTNCDGSPVTGTNESYRPNCGITITDYPHVGFSVEQKQTTSATPPCPAQAQFCLANATDQGDVTTINPVPVSGPTPQAVGTPGAPMLYLSWNNQVPTSADNLQGAQSYASLYNAIYDASQTISPLVSYVFSLPQPTATTHQRFLCPSGVFAEVGDVSAIGGVNSVSAMLQTVPGVLKINSPIDLTIPTVPPGFEDPSVACESAEMFYQWTDNLKELDPAAPALTGFISTTRTDGSPINATGNSAEPFCAGGSGIRAVKTHLALPEGLPEGFTGRLVATLQKAPNPSTPGAPAQIQIISTYLVSHDHLPPTVSAAATVRDQNGVVVTATASDPTSQVAFLELDPTLNASTQPIDEMSFVSGDFYGPTNFRASFAVSPSATYGLTLSANDTHLNPVTFTLPVASTGGDRQVECDSQAGANVVLDGSRSTGPGGMSFLWSGPFGSASGTTVVEPLPFGPSSVTLGVADPATSFSGTETSIISVGDTTPPTLTVSASPSCIWPPNHKSISFNLGAAIQYTVHDTCDPNPTVRIVSVTASDGSPVTFDGTHLCTIADKDVNYTITVSATDAHGNTSYATTTVSVPHDLSSGQSCADPNTMQGC